MKYHYTIQFNKRDGNKWENVISQFFDDIDNTWKLLLDAILQVRVWRMSISPSLVRREVQMDNPKNKNAGLKV